MRSRVTKHVDNIYYPAPIIMLIDNDYVLSFYASLSHASNAEL